MEHLNTELSRSEFVKLAITKVTPFVLALVAILVGFFVYDIFDSSSPWIGLVLLFGLLLLFFYPMLKRRYGERLWNRLPYPVQQAARGLKIILIVLFGGFLLLVGLSMPLFLALACIDLWIDNYKLREELEEKDAQLSQAG